MRIIFFGTPAFAAEHLRAVFGIPGASVRLVVTNPDKPAGRGKNVSAPPVKVLAGEAGVPVVQPPSLRKDASSFLADLSRYGPFDIGVVVAYGQILPVSVLALPASGCVNMHASLLPRWRGAAPIQRAVMAGDSETGMCVMKMEEGLDTGPVYDSERIAIEPNDTAGDLQDKLASLGGALLSRTLHGIASGKLIPVPQADSGITYAGKISNAEAHIGWEYAANSVRNFIHGLSPFPGAYAFMDGKRLKIYRARSILNTDSGHLPGTVVRASGYELRVACASGALSILELQLEGKRRLSSEEFLKAGLIEPGTVLS